MPCPAPPVSLPALLYPLSPSSSHVPSLLPRSGLRAACLAELLFCHCRISLGSGWLVSLLSDGDPARDSRVSLRHSSRNPPSPIHPSPDLPPRLSAGCSCPVRTHPPLELARIEGETCLACLPAPQIFSTPAALVCLVPFHLGCRGDVGGWLARVLPRWVSLPPFPSRLWARRALLCFERSWRRLTGLTTRVPVEHGRYSMEPYALRWFRRYFHHEPPSPAIAMLRFLMCLPQAMYVLYDHLWGRGIPSGLCFYLFYLFYGSRTCSRYCMYLSYMILSPPSSTGITIQAPPHLTSLARTVCIEYNVRATPSAVDRSAVPAIPSIPAAAADHPHPHPHPHPSPCAISTLAPSFLRASPSVPRGPPSRLSLGTITPRWHDWPCAKVIQCHDILYYTIRA